MWCCLAMPKPLNHKAKTFEYCLFFSTEFVRLWFNISFRWLIKRWKNLSVTLFTFSEILQCSCLLWDSVIVQSCSVEKYKGCYTKFTPLKSGLKFDWQNYTLHKIEIMSDWGIKWISLWHKSRNIFSVEMFQNIVLHWKETVA